MISLFIDTSLSDVTIALIKDNKIISSLTKSIPNAHSIYTVDFIDKVIKDSSLTTDDIDNILVVTGPGSFTGVRIGVTIAKTFAYLKNIKVVSVSSLKMRSLSTSHDYCLSLVDAHHDNYYIGLYDKDNNEVIEEQFNSKDKVLELIDKYHPLIISSEEIILNDIKAKIQELDLISIINYYKELDGVNPHLLVPNYLKLPQALEEKHD